MTPTLLIALMCYICCDHFLIHHLLLHILCSMRRNIVSPNYGLFALRCAFLCEIMTQMVLGAKSPVTAWNYGLFTTQNKINKKVTKNGKPLSRVTPVQSETAVQVGGCLQTMVENICGKGEF